MLISDTLHIRHPRVTMNPSNSLHLFHNRAHKLCLNPTSCCKYDMVRCFVYTNTIVVYIDSHVNYSVCFPDDSLCNMLTIALIGHTRTNKRCVVLGNHWWNCCHCSTEPIYPRHLCHCSIDLTLCR